MQSDNQIVVNEILRSVQFLVDELLKQTTKIYDGLITEANNDGSWNIRYNGESHTLKPYGSIVPVVGAVVKVVVPQGNQNLAYFM